MRSKVFLLLPLGLIAILLAAGCSHPRNYTRNNKEKDSTSIFAGRAGRYGFADVRQIDPTIVVDLRYATRQNVVGKNIYPWNMPCLVQESTAHRLSRAQAILKAQGYGLKIWDAYRPPQSHLALWNAFPDENYVVAPKNGWSRHCLGMAVDVTLVDEDGREMKMPTGFDDFSRSASATYIGSDATIRRNLDRLQDAMRRSGFRTIASEWWHFEDSYANGNRLVSAKNLGITLPPHVAAIPMPSSSSRGREDR